MFIFLLSSPKNSTAKTAKILAENVPPTEMTLFCFGRRGTGPFDFLKRGGGDLCRHKFNPFRCSIKVCMHGCFYSLYNMHFLLTERVSVKFIYVVVEFV